MPTGDEKVNLVLKRFLSQNRMGANFLEYLSNMTIDGLSRIFPHSGVFTYPVSCTFPSAGHFSLSPDPVEGIDNAGHVLIADTDYVTSIPYEEAAASLYWLGLDYCQISSGVYANPRTGIPEYDKLRDEIGMVSNPSAVVDAGGGTIQLNVSTVLQSGVNNAGRVVRVWLTDPLSSDPAVAFEDCTVTYSAPNNLITTTGSLGQATITTTISAYKIACLGVRVIKNATNPFTDSTIVLGYINTTGSPSFTDTDQIDLSGGGGHTLQRAYDGTGGSGSGRTISIAGTQAVLLAEQAATCYEDDIANAALRIKKDNTTSLPGVGFEKEGAIDIATRFNSLANILVRAAIADCSGGDFLRIEETANITSPKTVTLTRSGVDLDSVAYGNIHGGVDYVEIFGATNTGVYLLETVFSSSVTVTNIDGTTAALSNETGVAVRFFRPLVELAKAPRVLRANLLADFLRDITPGSPSSEGQIEIRAHGTIRDDEPIIRVYNNGTTAFRVRADGSVLAAKSMTVDLSNYIANSGDYTFSAARGYYRIFPLGNAVFKPDPTKWTCLAGSDFLVHKSDETDENGVFIPVEVPDGATVISAKLILYVGTGVGYHVSFIACEADFTTPGSSTLTETHVTTGTGAAAYLTVSLSSISEVMDRSVKTFYVYARQTTAGQFSVCGGLQVYFSINKILP